MRQIKEIKENIKFLFSRLESEFGRGYLRDKIGIKDKSIEQCLTTGDTDAGSLHRALKSFGANFELLSYKDIDIQTVVNKWNGVHEIPLTYRQNNYSKARITQNIISILENSCGNDITDKICNFIQMDKATLQNLKADSNLFTQINGDIYYYLKRYCSFSNHDLFSLGQKVTDIYKENNIFHNLNSYSVKECYTLFLEEVRKILRRALGMNS